MMRQWYTPDMERRLMQSRATQRYALPPVNILLDEQGLHIELAAPGYDKEQFELTLDGNVLTISGKPANGGEQKNGQWLRREFVTGAFERSFALPEGLDLNNVQASYENGILRIHLPVAQPERPRSRKIEVT